MIEYKGYQIKPHKSLPCHYIVVTSGKGGKIPDILTGMFTSPGIAKRGVDHYLSSKTKKEMQNDEEINKD